MTALEILNEIKQKPFPIIKSMVYHHNITVEEEIKRYKPIYVAVWDMEGYTISYPLWKFKKFCKYRKHIPKSKIIDSMFIQEMETLYVIIDKI